MSMAANAGTKLRRVIQNLERLLAIEFMTATQALEFRKPKVSGSFITTLLEDYRKEVPSVVEDRILSDDMHKTLAFLKTKRTDIADLFKKI